MTQFEFVRRLNKSQSYVSKVRILESRIDVIELMDWLAALSIRFDELNLKEILAISSKA